MELVYQALCIIFIYFAVPAIAPPIDAPNAAHGAAPTDPAIGPTAPPTNETTVDPMLLLSDAVPLFPGAILSTHNNTPTRDI